jgi:hypothetical protein
MTLRRKSLHRSRNQKHAKKRANQRAAKERHRIARALADPVLPDCSHVEIAKAKPSGFRITIECLDDDGERATFTTARGPFGLTISATDAGRRVSSVLLHYKPI